jgi:anti-sigma B factor antagonist
MPLHVRIDRDLVILSNFGRLMSDPRYVDAVEEVHRLIDQGYDQFVLEVADVRETGRSVLGVLMTIMRALERRGASAVLARPSRELARFLAQMRLDDYWEIFDSLEEARSFLRSEISGGGDR